MVHLPILYWIDPVGTNEAAIAHVPHLFGMDFEVHVTVMDEHLH